MKTRIALVFGGSSGEHEVSQISAASVWRNLDRNRFDPVLIAIDREGRWFSVPTPSDPATQTLTISADSVPIALVPSVPRGYFVPLATPHTRIEVDAVFPVVHGTRCEDGTLQGALETLNLPYVGCGVLASAVGMDKEVAKRLAQSAGVPVVPYALVTAASASLPPGLSLPVFVKPASQGSSLGVHKVEKMDQLLPALQDALRFDNKILIEKAIQAREIEVSALESPDGTVRTSIAGEIRPKHAFYSYDAKYLDPDGAELIIPASLSAAQQKEVQSLAARAFTALGGEGMGRMDFFLDTQSGEFLFNEVNTIPGFTSISMYPKLWEATGLGYSDLLSALIELALQRFERRAGLLKTRD